MSRHESIHQANVYGESMTSAAVVVYGRKRRLTGRRRLEYMAPEWKIREIGVVGNSQGQTDPHRVLLLEKVVGSEKGLWYKAASSRAVGRDSRSRAYYLLYSLCLWSDLS